MPSADRRKIKTRAPAAPDVAENGPLDFEIVGRYVRYKLTSLQSHIISPPRSVRHRHTNPKIRSRVPDFSVRCHCSGATLCRTTGVLEGMQRFDAIKFKKVASGDELLSKSPKLTRRRDRCSVRRFSYEPDLLHDELRWSRNASGISETCDDPLRQKLERTLLSLVREISSAYRCLDLGLTPESPGANRKHRGSQPSNALEFRLPKI